MNAKTTLIGFYNYRPDIFDNVTFPAGIDKNIAIDTILVNNAGFEPLYQDIDFFKFCIENWAKKWSWSFDKWIKAINVKYDPLNNYDRYEEYDDEKKGTEKTKSSSDRTIKDTGTADTEEKVSAYDSSSYEPSKKNTLTNNLTTTEKAGSDISGDSSETIKHRAHLYGNIGVTTSQQMLESELSIAEWNLYNQIADVFRSELLISVY